MVFKVTLGYKRVLYVKNIRQQVSQPLLHNAQVSDLALQLNLVGKDRVELVGLGNLHRMGEVLFADAQGETAGALHLGDRDAGSQAHQQRAAAAVELRLHRVARGGQHDDRGVSHDFTQDLDRQIQVAAALKRE